MWWLENVGSLLSATVTDSSGAVQAWLAPGARLPIVFPQLQVLFSAGSTTHDFTVHSSERVLLDVRDRGGPGRVHHGRAGHAHEFQRLLVLSLAEHVLRQDSPGRGELPASADAAARLGWPMTTFNRKLDNVCEKLDKVGVPGLRGGRDRLASNRRQRLVEYAVATRLVSAEDLRLLDLNAARTADAGPRMITIVNEETWATSVGVSLRVLFRHDSGERVGPMQVRSR